MRRIRVRMRGMGRKCGESAWEQRGNARNMGGNAKDVGNQGVDAENQDGN